MQFLMVCAFMATTQLAFVAAVGSECNFSPDDADDADEATLMQIQGVAEKVNDQECTTAMSWTDAPCAQLCPPSTSSHSCPKIQGCAYVYASNDENKLPAAFVAMRKQCVATNAIVGAAPPGSVWESGDTGSRGASGLLVKTDEGKLTLKFGVEEEINVGEGDCKAGVDASPRPPASEFPPTRSVTHTLHACQCAYWQVVDSLDDGIVKSIETNYAFANQHPDEFLQVEYGCWRNVLSKSLRMPVQFEYIATGDIGNEERHHYFPLDETPGLEDWQPPLWSKSNKYGTPYDVGHLVMANHFDGFKELIEATNLMTNVLPQLGDMNRYAWLATEMLTECARESAPKENVFVIGGCVWPENAASIPGFAKMEEVGYSIKIPDYCWKILRTTQRGHVAFWIPNNSTARITKSKAIGDNGIEKGLDALGEFVVSVAKLEELLSDRQTPQNFSMSDEEKQYTPTAQNMADNGWSLGCDMK